MKTKKQIFITLVATIFFTTPLLNGMLYKMPDVFDLKDLNQFYKIEINLYGKETKKLDLSNRGITKDFLTKNQIPLQKFIEENKIQVLDLQHNGLTTIPVCILKILLTQGSPLQEINIVTPKLSVEHRDFNFTNETTINDLLYSLKNLGLDKKFEIVTVLAKKQLELESEKIISLSEKCTIYLILIKN